MTTYTINPAASRIYFHATVEVRDLKSLGWDFEFENGIAEMYISGTSNDLKTKVGIYTMDSTECYTEEEIIENDPRILTDVISLLGNGSVDIYDDYTRNKSWQYVPTFIEA